MSVGKVAIFELHSTDPDSDIAVNVTRTYRLYHLLLPYTSLTIPKYIQQVALDSYT